MELEQCFALAGWLAGWLEKFSGRQAGWLAGWLVEFTGWLAGWLEKHRNPMDSNTFPAQINGKSMETNANQWEPMEINGNLRKSMETYGNQWKSMEINGNKVINCM